MGDKDEGSIVQIFTDTISSREVNIFINREIGDPSQYGEVNQSLRSVEEHDKVNIFFNSNGGRVDATVEIINNIMVCKAPVIGHLMGDANSAAGMLFLSCDDWVLYELSSMMVHAPSSGLGGHVSNVISGGDFLRTHSKLLMETCYRGFLTDDEISGLLNGSPDLYMFAEQIDKRLNSLKEYREKLEEVKKEEGKK